MMEELVTRCRVIRSMSKRQHRMYVKSINAIMYRHDSAKLFSNTVSPLRNIFAMVGRKP